MLEIKADPLRDVKSDFVTILSGGPRAEGTEDRKWSLDLRMPFGEARRDGRV
jgi:hypothetical protein